MKFYNSMGPNPQVVRMFAAERGITLDMEEVDLMGGENRQEDYLKKNPGGQLPCLELDDGSYITEFQYGQCAAWVTREMLGCVLLALGQADFHHVQFDAFFGDEHALLGGIGCDGKIVKLHRDSSVGVEAVALPR